MAELNLVELLKVCHESTCDHPPCIIPPELDRAQQLFEEKNITIENIHNLTNKQFLKIASSLWMNKTKMVFRLMKQYLGIKTANRNNIDIGKLIIHLVNNDKVTDVWFELNQENSIKIKSLFQDENPNMIMNQGKKLFVSKLQTIGMRMGNGIKLWRSMKEYFENNTNLMSTNDVDIGEVLINLINDKAITQPIRLNEEMVGKCRLLFSDDNGFSLISKGRNIFSEKILNGIGVVQRGHVGQIWNGLIEYIDDINGIPPTQCILEPETKHGGDEKMDHDDKVNNLCSWIWRFDDVMLFDGYIRTHLGSLEIPNELKILCLQYYGLSIDEIKRVCFNKMLNYIHSKLFKMHGMSWYFTLHNCDNNKMVLFLHLADNMSNNGHLSRICIDFKFIIKELNFTKLCNNIHFYHNNGCVFVALMDKHKFLRLDSFTLNTEMSMKGKYDADGHLINDSLDDINRAMTMEPDFVINSVFHNETLKEFLDTEEGSYWSDTDGWPWKDTIKFDLRIFPKGCNGTGKDSLGIKLALFPVPDDANEITLDIHCKFSIIEMNYSGTKVLSISTGGIGRGFQEFIPNEGIIKHEKLTFRAEITVIDKKSEALELPFALK